MLRPQLNEPSHESSSSSSRTVFALVNSFYNSSPRLCIVLFPPIPLLQIPFVTLLSMENRGRGFQLGAHQKPGGSVWFSRLHCKRHFSTSNKRKATQRERRHDLKLFYHHKRCSALYSLVQLVSHVVTIVCSFKQSSLQITYLY